MVNKSKQNAQSQLERATAILIDLRPDITSEDRDEAMKKLDLSEPTLSRYLNGEAKKIGTALNLIEFFQKRISDREKKLDAIEPTRA
ncbi:MAG: hypothetical protein ACJ749_06845 [Flavisolibacter sp.]|jgi:hypothetical protein